VRHWRQVVLKPLGLEAHEELVEIYFAHVTHVVYLDWLGHPDTREQARLVAEWMGKPFSVRSTDGGQIETFLEAILGRASQANIGRELPVVG
jgi:hypothetical protein